MAESLSTAQKRRVYIHCRPIFSGVNARLRKQKKITELVNRNKASLQELLKDIGQGQLIKILKSLLERRIFEAEAHAKVEFPDLFSSSPLRDVQRQTFENDAARSTEEVLDSIGFCHSDGSDTDGMEDSETGEDGEKDGEAVKFVNGDKKVETLPLQLVAETLPSRHNLPSLYPSYLPYRTQHLILTAAQQVLEECCFDFAAAAMPSVLREKKWDCPMAVELRKWTKLFRKGKDKLTVQTIPIDFASEEVHKTLTAVTRLRHTAVHRLPTTARGISQLLDAAVKLAQTLQDNLRAAQLDELRSEINTQIEAMELNKNVLEDTVSAEVQRKREELERMETELIQRMLKDDLCNKTLIGCLLEDSVRRIFRGEKHNEGDEGDEKEEKDDKWPNDWWKEQEDGKELGQEQNEEDDSSGYETSVEEKPDNAA